jgi:hypothetical protein
VCSTSFGRLVVPEVKYNNCGSPGAVPGCSAGGTSESYAWLSGTHPPGASPKAKRV